MYDQQQMAQAPPPPQQMLVAQCPPGLEPLVGLESVWIHQKVDLVETFLPIETKNKYQITDHRGVQCYMAFEQSNVFARQLLETGHPFKMDIIDNYGRMIFYCDRPWQCCDDQVTVHLYDGTILGSVTHGWCACWNSEFKVFDQNRSHIFNINGPPCGCSLNTCCMSAKYNVYPVHSKKPVAQIRKEFSGFLQEVATDADIFGVEFPIDLDARMKAVLIGAVFLIDFTYYETSAS